MDKITYLSHHGIPGMKWGRRRFQYEDGSLTPLGKQRYGTKEDLYKAINKEYGSVENLDNQSKRRVENLDKSGKVLSETSKIFKDASQIGLNSRKSKTINNKDYSSLTDDDLRKRINRINMERSYAELVGDAKRVRSGEDWIREVLQTAGAAVGIVAGGVMIANTIVDIKNKKAPKGGN